MKHFLIIVFVFSCSLGYCQTTIEIKNPSFDGKPYPGTSMKPFLKGWVDFAYRIFPEESSFDLHGSKTDYFNVKKNAYDGNTYIGMVTRKDGTYEIIGQKLSSPIIKDKKYKISIYVCSSKLYLSHIRSEVKIPLPPLSEFIQPVKLQLWGVSYNEGGKGMISELLAETITIENEDWKKYVFIFSPTENDYKYIALNPMSIDEEVPTNGNVLLDMVSDIVEIKE